MKLKKVAALCGSANAFCLFDRVDGDGVVTQWLGDGCRSEVRAEDMDVTISSGGKVLMPLRFPGGLLFIQSKYLGPLEDQMDFLELYVRRSDSGGRYVVAKTGMLVAGVIFPVQAVNEGFCDKLEELASLTRRELDRHLSAPPVAEEEDKDQENVFGGSDGET